MPIFLRGLNLLSGAYPGLKVLEQLSVAPLGLKIAASGTGADALSSIKSRGRWALRRCDVFGA